MLSNVCSCQLCGTDMMRCPAALQSPGKLVRQLVQDGEHVLEGQAFAEIEVMKMIQTLASPAAGVISFQVRPQLCCCG